MIPHAGTRTLRPRMCSLEDSRARHREFLTGFHKRKLQKKEDAKAKAIEREKQERLEARREVCLLVSCLPSSSGSPHHTRL